MSLDDSTHFSTLSKSAESGDIGRQCKVQNIYGCQHQNICNFGVSFIFYMHRIAQWPLLCLGIFMRPFICFARAFRNFYTKYCLQGSYQTKDNFGDIIINLITNIMNVWHICCLVYHPHIKIERNLDERKASYVHWVLSYYQMHTFE